MVILMVAIILAGIVGLALGAISAPVYYVVRFNIYKIFRHTPITEPWKMIRRGISFLISFLLVMGAIAVIGDITVSSLVSHFEVPRASIGTAMVICLLSGFYGLGIIQRLSARW
jgi:hypothetical protein